MWLSWLLGKYHYFFYEKQRGNSGKMDGKSHKLFPWDQGEARTPPPPHLLNLQTWKTMNCTSSRAGSLNHGIPDIWGRIIPRAGGCPVYWWQLSSIPDLHPRDAHSTSPTQLQPRMSPDVTKRLLAGGGQNHLQLKTSRLQSDRLGFKFQICHFLICKMRTNMTHLKELGGIFNG